MNLAIITGSVLICYELNLFFQLKKLLGWKAHEYVKPFDCFFCLSLWGNLIAFTLTYLITGNLLLQELGYQILITKIIDLLWNKN